MGCGISIDTMCYIESSEAALNKNFSFTKILEFKGFFPSVLLVTNGFKAAGLGVALILGLVGSPAVFAGPQQEILSVTEKIEGQFRKGIQSWLEINQEKI